MLQGGNKMKNTRQILSLILAIVLCIATIFMLTACKDDTNNNSETQNINSSVSVNSSSQNSANDSSSPTAQSNSNQGNTPNEDDIEGWFSLEVINQYSMAPFVQPPDTKVVSKPDRDCLYLKGDKNTFTLCTQYAFDTMLRNNKAVYLPEKNENSDSFLSYKKITYYDFSTLYPTGDTTDVTFIYTMGHSAYECSISYDKGTEQVCIRFADRTELYRDIVQ